MKFLSKIIKEEKGQAVVIVALAMVALLGFTALAVDGGALYLERRNMVTAADAAALAGAKELYLSDNNTAKAVAEAKKYAEANGAAITDEIEVVDVDYNGETVKGVSVNVGRNVDYTFGRVLGLDNTDVMAKATAVWLYPTHYAGDLFPVFFEHSGGDLPGDQQVLLDEKLTAGDWGLLDVGSGMSDVNDVFAGEPYSAGELVAYYSSGGDYVLAYTEPGNAQSRIDAIETRMVKAKNPDSGVTMEGVIPIVGEFTENGKAVLKIIGFASFLIEDVITAETKETDDLWWGRGSIEALDIANPPKLYGGYPKKQDLSDEFPKGSLIGHFLEKNFIPASEVIAGTQDSDYDYGTLTVKLIK